MASNTALLNLEEQCSMRPVKILSSDGKSITTYGLLHNGSHGTMISSEVAKELDLKRQEMVSVSTLLQQDEEFEVVEFKLQSASGEGELNTVEGLVARSSTSQRSAFQKISTGDHIHI